jgi:hypothetical protein
MTIDTGYVRARNEDGTIWWMGGGFWAGERRQAVLVLRSTFDAAAALFAEQRKDDCPDNGFFGPYRTTFIPNPVEPHHALLHETLVEAGYSYTREPCTFEDDGDAESGPHLTGGPEFDQYESPVMVEELVMETLIKSPEHTVYVLPSGEVDLIKYEPNDDWWGHGDDGPYGCGPQPSKDDEGEEVSSPLPMNPQSIIWPEGP